MFMIVNPDPPDSPLKLAGCASEATAAYTPGQGELLPSYTADALDPTDPASFVDEVVEDLDLRTFERRYSGLGERTINRFRTGHVADFRAVLRETVRIAREAGLAKLGRVAIDGTKLRANTSRYKAMSRGRMDEAEARLDDEIGQILLQIEEQNAAENEEPGDDDGSGGLPEELPSREARRERIRAARARLEAEKGERLEDRHQKSFADIEANMMKTGRAPWPTATTRRRP